MDKYHLRQAKEQILPNPSLDRIRSGIRQVKNSRALKRANSAARPITRRLLPYADKVTGTIRNMLRRGR